MLKWKGIDFRDKGIIVEKTPAISKGKKNIDVYTIPGRNGFLSVDNGTYEEFVVSVECHFNSTNYSFDKVKEFLDGYGTLSFDGLKEYTAIINNSISFEKIENFKKFIVQFLVNPIAEDIVETSLTIDETSANIDIDKATATMYPTLEITGSGDVSVTINNKTFYLKGIDGKCILDCKNKVITSNGINISNKMLNDFPTLQPGSNSISMIGTVTAFVIKFKRAYL